MRIKFNKDEAQLELVRAIGSKNRTESTQALEIFAGLIGKVIQEVLNQADVTSMIYETESYSEDDPFEIPVDLYAGKGANEVRVWSQNVAGGLGSSMVGPYETVRFDVYTLFSAVHWLKKFARKARMNVISKALERLANEILVQQNTNRIVPVLRALAEANTNSTSHVITSTTSNVFQLDDLNRLMTLMKRIRTSWNNGTPDRALSRGLTDLLVSPEIMQQVRGFSYQPMNTRVGTDGTSDDATAVALPDATREKILAGGGLPEIFNVTLHELNELGAGYEWNVLFDTFYTGSFNPSTDEIVIGLDLTRGAFVRPVVTEEGGGEITVLPDDQFVSRQDKAGVYASVTEAALVTDARALVGVIV